MTHPETSLPELTREQLLRYSRHVMLPSFDMQGQERLLASKVLVIGMGGLGCAAAPYLAASGIGQLTLVDHDVVDNHNLPRQTLFTAADIGNPKVTAAQAYLQQRSPDCNITAVQAKATDTNLEAWVQSHDVVVDCCDNLATRNLINQTCRRHITPHVMGAAIRYEGQLSVFTHQDEGPCYACLSQLFGEQQLSCMEAGILAPIVGVVGALQAVETLKLLAGVGAPISHKVMLYDGLHGEWRSFNLPRHPQCPECSA